MRFISNNLDLISIRTKFVVCLLLEGYCRATTEYAGERGV